MAESVTLSVECPATPERIDQCPDTPDRILNLKSPDSSTSSDTECPINLRTRSTDSPPPNCAICLGRCKNKCFTDSCLHQFCFKCLLEWSKVKAECPLCKQPFNSIIHNVKSIDQFEEYLVAQPEPTSQNIPSVPLPMPPLAHHHPQPHPSHLISSHHHSRSASASAVAVAAAAAAHSLYPHRFDVFLGDYPRFRSELSNGYSTTVQVHPSDNETLQQIFLHRSLLVDRLRQQYPDEAIPPGSLGQLWRRYIYDRRLYAMPVVDITGRYRDCTARFFRDNPAQMHRLMAWLNRDVVCLLRESEHHASYVLNVISELLTIFNITSPEFRRRIQPYFRERTAHFIHEFLNFARSPYDMIGYDREVRYSPYYEEVVISSSSSSSGFSDSEDIVQIRGPRRGRTEFTIETRSNSSTFILTGTIEGQTGQVPHSTPRPSGIFEVNSISTGNVNQLQVLGQSQVIQIDRNIILSSSSSDECEFVSARKPPHLRTPELISLNSASDSDVVFVSEVVKNRPSEISTGRPGVSTRKRRPPKHVLTTTLSASSSLSSSSESENDEKATAAMSKQKKNLDKFKRETKSTTSASNNKNNDEYNNGASTSSGLQGSEKSLNKPIKMRNGMCCKKYYGRPIRQTTSKRLKNMKSIYEESSTDDDSDKTTSDESFKCEKSSNSSDSSKVLSKLRQKHQKRKYEHKRRSHKGASSGKKKKSKKSSRKRSKRRKLSSSSSKVRSKRSHRIYTSSSSEKSSSSSTSDLCCSSNGWSSSCSE